MKTTCAPIT